MRLHLEARIHRDWKICLYHTVIFNHFHVKVDDAIVVYLDFETTGLDVMNHGIVEV